MDAKRRPHDTARYTTGARERTFIAARSVFGAEFWQIASRSDALTCCCAFPRRHRCLYSNFLKVLVLMKTLFTGHQLSGLQLPNRIVMAPMTRSRAADTIPNDETALYYAQRAGAGLIVTEGSQVSHQGVGYLFTPGIHTEEQAAGWRKVTHAVHKHGGRIYSQLWHVSRISHVSLHENRVSPVGPTSKMAENTASFAYDENGNPGSVQVSPPRPLLTNEVKSTVQDFANAAAKAIDAGFDGVEVHGANGYLIEQFMNAGINDRDDQYGGGTI